MIYRGGGGSGQILRYLDIRAHAHGSPARRTRGSSFPCRSPFAEEDHGRQGLVSDFTEVLQNVTDL